jgi:hypothetical protein
MLTLPSAQKINDSDATAFPAPGNAPTEFADTTRARDDCAGRWIWEQRLLKPRVLIVGQILLHEPSEQLGFNEADHQIIIRQCRTPSVTEWPRRQLSRNEKGGVELPAEIGLFWRRERERDSNTTWAGHAPAPRGKIPYEALSNPAICHKKPPLDYSGQSRPQTQDRSRPFSAAPCFRAVHFYSGGERGIRTLLRPGMRLSSGAKSPMRPHRILRFATRSRHRVSHRHCQRRLEARASNRCVARRECPALSTRPLPSGSANGK